jgi:hypothetical protein
MKHLGLLVVLIAVVSIVVAAGCQSMTSQPSAHDRYRQYTHRTICESDGIAIQDDLDAVFLCERPTHLAQWYFP